MGSPSTIPPTDSDELAALIISTFAEVTSVPLEITAASSIAIASSEQESLFLRPVPAGRAMKRNFPKERRKTAEQDHANKKKSCDSIYDHLR